MLVDAGSTFSIVTTKDHRMFYLVILESGRIAGLFTSPVDSHLRLKALRGAGRVVMMRANEDYNDSAHSIVLNQPTLTTQSHASAATSRAESWLDCSLRWVLVFALPSLL